MRYPLIRNIRYVTSLPASGLLLRRTAKYRALEVNRLRKFHSSTSRNVVIPYMLADIGEGITECQIMEWFVEPGARVEQFDKICEVQSDKASVEITSRFDGVITALHYAQDDMAKVGKPLVDIDVDGEISLGGAGTTQQPTDKANPEPEKLLADDIQQATEETEPEVLDPLLDNEARQSLRQNLPPPTSPQETVVNTGSARGITTPGVRHLLKEHNIDINEVTGTGKDGRVRKEDIQKYLAARASSPAKEPSSSTTSSIQPSTEDKIIPLTVTENQMFKVMTESLSIPQFLYTHSVDITSVNALRARFNSKSVFSPDSPTKLSSLPFILKALSYTLLQFPKVNAHLDTTSSPKPQLILKSAHNFGIAIDTPQGLLVPVVKNVQNHSIISLSAEIKRLSDLAQRGKLAPDDFKGATISVSNIGSIGGGVVSPVIVRPMVAIVGIGRAKNVPVWVEDGEGGERVERREEVVLSWSADHRVLDGATVAKCAEKLKVVLEGMELLGVELK